MKRDCCAIQPANVGGKLTRTKANSAFQLNGLSNSECRLFGLLAVWRDPHIPGSPVLLELTFTLVPGLGYPPGPMHIEDPCRGARRDPNLGRLIKVLRFLELLL